MVQSLFSTLKSKHSNASVNFINEDFVIIRILYKEKEEVGDFIGQRSNRVKRDETKRFKYLVMRKDLRECIFVNKVQQFHGNSLDDVQFKSAVDNAIFASYSTPMLSMYIVTQGVFDAQLCYVCHCRDTEATYIANYMHNTLTH